MLIFIGGYVNPNNIDIYFTMTSKIKNIATIVDYFDFLIKRSAPLDDVIITPYSEYGSEESRLTSSRRSNKKRITNYIMDLPSIEEFKSHYQYTNVKYRIIYSEKYLD